MSSGKPSKTLRLSYPLYEDILSMDSLTDGDKIIYSVIAFKIGGNSHSWVGARKLAQITGKPKSAVLNSIMWLEEVGLITVERRNNGQSNHYKLPANAGHGPGLIGKKERAKFFNETGPKSVPVQNLYRSKIRTRTGPKSGPQPVQNLDHKITGKEQEKNNCDNSLKKIPCQKFKKPSIPEIENYLAEKQITSIDPEVFFDYYQSKGWKVGKSPMKDWQAALRTWIKRQTKTIKADNDDHYILDPAKEARLFGD